MRILARSFAILAGSMLLFSGDEAYPQSLPGKHVPVDMKVVLSTLDQDASVNHRINGGEYEIEVAYEKSMLGVKKLDLSIDSGEPGEWSESTVTSGSTLNVKRTGKQEPRGCIVESIYTMEKDPAAAYEIEVMDRLRGAAIVVDPRTATNEVNRLVKEYGYTTQHVLKLPRSASSRLDPEDTLRRLCRWIAYDKMFKKLAIDARPVATETDAKNLYEQVLGLLRGDSLPDDETEHLISAEELERIEEAYRFNYAVTFRPNLAPGESDRNWRKAERVSFVDGHAGTVLWRGELRQGHQSTAWLALRTRPDASDLEIIDTKKSADLQWNFVEGADDWRYVRLLNVSKSSPTPFHLRIIGDKNAAEIQLTLTDLLNLQFPF